MLILILSLSIILTFFLIIYLLHKYCYKAIYKIYFWDPISSNISILNKFNINPSNKKIISVSLFGTKQKYFDGARKMMNDIDNVFPGWKLRVYMHYRVPVEIIDEFKNRECQLVIVKQDNVTPSDSTFWRFLAAEDDVIFLSRDVDYNLNKYDYYLTNMWIKDNDTKFMRYDFYRILKLDMKFLGVNVFAAGLWGGRDRCVPNMLELINNFKRRSRWHSDEVFLETKMLPYIKEKKITIFVDKFVYSKRIYNKDYVRKYVVDFGGKNRVMGALF